LTCIQWRWWWWMLISIILLVGNLCWKRVHYVCLASVSLYSDINSDMKLLIMIIDWVVLLLLSDKVQQANYHCHKFFTDQMDKYQHAPNREDDRVSWSIAWESQLEKNTFYLPCIRGFCVIVWMVAGSFLLCPILEMYYDWSEKMMAVDGRKFLIVSNLTCTQWI
jgi:hypothetical protein